MELHPHNEYITNHNPNTLTVCLDSSQTFLIVRVVCHPVPLQGRPHDPRPHHPGPGPHRGGPEGHPAGHGAHPADPAAEVLPAPLPAGRAHRGPAGLHGHHGERQYFVCLIQTRVVFKPWWGEAAVPVSTVNNNDHNGC